MIANGNAALEYWRYELTPWLNALEGQLCVDLVMPTREEIEDVWIRFEPVDGSFEPAKWTLIHEALELIDLLVRVDADVGWNLLFSIRTCSRTFATYEAALCARHKVLPRYELHIESAEIRTFFQSVFLGLRRMIGEDDQPWEPPSPEFPRVKNLLLEAWKRKHNGRDVDRNTEGRIVVVPEMLLSSDFRAQPVPFMVQHSFVPARASRTLLPSYKVNQTSVEHGLLSTDSKTEREQVQLRQRRAVLCFESFKFELANHPATNLVLYYLLDLAKRGVPISELVLDQVMMPRLAGAFFVEVLGS